MKKYEHIMLFSDMDGTLLDSQGKVSKENQEAVSCFMEQGGKFGIATGRSQLNSVLFLEDVEVNAPCILYNGGGIYDFAAAKFIVLNELNKEKLSLFLKDCLVKHKEVSIQVYCPQMSYFVSPEDLADSQTVSLHQPCQFTQIDAIMDQPWIKILLSGRREELQLLNSIKKEYGLEEEISSVFSAVNYLEFLPYGTSKGKALSKLREHMGSEYKIYAVGDYNNDIEMLKEADVGIATQNAIPSLKEVADAITVSNDESAIADIIYHMIEK